MIAKTLGKSSIMKHAEKLTWILTAKINDY